MLRDQQPTQPDADDIVLAAIVRSLAVRQQTPEEIAAAKADIGIALDVTNSLTRITTPLVHDLNRTLKRQRDEARIAGFKQIEEEHNQRIANGQITSRKMLRFDD